MESIYLTNTVFLCAVFLLHSETITFKIVVPWLDPVFAPSEEASKEDAKNT